MLMLKTSGSLQRACGLDRNLKVNGFPRSLRQDLFAVPLRRMTRTRALRIR
jgi:hypothetical protein